MRRAAVFVLLFFAFAANAANQLIVDVRSMRMSDIATITLSLEGQFAEVEAASPPLENLTILGEPWVASEFIFVNGRLARRKVFRFRVRPNQPGRATVGPMTLHGDDGGTDVLPQIVLNVDPLRGLGSNDPESLLRDLTASGRDPLFIVAEVEKTDVFVGEPVRVSWFLYNGIDVQQWQIVSVPKLQEFWTEEIPVRSEAAERVFVGDGVMQRVPIRRVVLYPLRSGSLHVDGMTLDAEVMHRDRRSFVFEGYMTGVTFFSAPITINAKPLPPGPAVDAVGDLRLECDQPLQRNAGPVVINVTLGGEANLRSVPAPHFEEKVAGELEIEGGQVATNMRDELSVGMIRRWRYLIFPSREGLLYVPPLALRTFVPATGERKTLRCQAATIEARAIASPAASSPNAAAPAVSRRDVLPWIGGVAIAALFAVFAVPRARRELALRRDVRAVVRGKSPAEIRAAVDARVPAAVMIANTDRGEAYRSLRSLLDAAERERDIAGNADAEIARRVRELFRIGR